jgi:TetR/AcrR family transcriptional repressor of nem operon
MRYHSEHKQQTHDKVLRAAARAIREQGPERVSVAAVMAEAGLTHGGFYAHFPSKEALVAASIAYMFERTDARLADSLPGKSPREALVAYIDFYLSEGHCAARDRGCPMAALGSDLPRLDAVSKKTFAAGMARLTKRLAGLLKAMDVDDPRSAADSLRAELLGALLSARLIGARERKAVLEASRHALRQRFGLGEST